MEYWLLGDEQLAMHRLVSGELAGASGRRA